MTLEESTPDIFFSESRNKSLQCYDWWIKDLRTYENIWHIATSQGNDCKTDCLLGSLYFEEHYKIIAIDLNKKQALHADPNAIQQIYITENLHRDGNKTIFFFT